MNNAAPATHTHGDAYQVVSFVVVVVVTELDVVSCAQVIADTSARKPEQRKCLKVVLHVNCLILMFLNKKLEARYGEFKNYANAQFSIISVLEFFFINNWVSTASGI